MLRSRHVWDPQRLKGKQRPDAGITRRAWTNIVQIDWTVNSLGKHHQTPPNTTTHILPTTTTHILPTTTPSVVLSITGIIWVIGRIEIKRTMRNIEGRKDILHTIYTLPAVMWCPPVFRRRMSTIRPVVLIHYYQFNLLYVWKKGWDESVWSSDGFAAMAKFFSKEFERKQEKGRKRKSGKDFCTQARK